MPSRRRMVSGRSQRRPRDRERKLTLPHLSRFLVYRVSELANPLLTRDGRSLVLRAGVATVALLVFFAMASGVLPVQCMLTGNACREPAVTVATASPEEVAMPSAPVAPSAEAAAEPAAPTLTHNDLIATTFAALPAELQHPQPLSDPKSLKPNAPTAAVPPARRIVRAVAIRPDGTPDPGTVAQ
eukprot:gene1131-1482_t